MKTKNKALVSLFVAMILIVAGGLCTYFTASTVYVHLREGEYNNDRNTSFSEDLHDTLSNAATALPFSIRLDDFSIDYHEGTRSPKNYISQVTLIDNGQEFPGRISMNKILRHRRYRIFQEDYDEDLLGSTLLIRHDPWGTALAYAGFALLILSMLWLLARREGAFRQLLSKLYLAPLLLFSLSSSTLPPEIRNLKTETYKPNTESHKLTTFQCLLTTELCNLIIDIYHLTPDSCKLTDNTCNLPHDTNQPVTLPCSLNTEESEAFGRLSVYYNGRIAPFDSYARDYCKAAFSKASIPEEYTPVQIVTAIYLFPERWPEKPRPALKLFPQENLWLTAEDDLSQAQSRDTLFIAHILDWLKISVQEEQHQQSLKIISSIATFQEKRCTPGSINRQREHLEIWYNQFKPERKIFIVNILLALLLFIMLTTASEAIWTKRSASVCLLIGLLLTLMDICLRCYLSGHNPFSGTFDTMLLLAAGILLIGLSVSAKTSFIALPALLASAFITFAATMMGGQSFSPLMPVLISPWLTMHVAVIMTSYCFFTLTFVLAIISLFFIIFQKDKNKILKVSILSRIFCILGVVFLATGIIIGSLWANISWGQYWSWDPKETWALITLLGYCTALPGVIPAADKHDWLYHLIIILAFFLLLTTYFGMSLFGGMHAY